MTLISQPKIKLADSTSQDAAGRLRVSSTSNQFDSILQFGVETWSPTLYDNWETVITGSASLTHLPNESSASLNLTTASGDKIVRQQHIYNRYEPAKSQQVILTGILGVKANVRNRIGYFDANDGLFFEHDGVNAKVVIRTSTSGSADDTSAVNQSAWNQDKLDGTGPSGLTIDLTKRQIFYIDFRWLSFGRVRFGFELNGQIIVCHQYIHTNTGNVPYMKTGNLPVRYEIENTATTTGATSMKQICSSVATEAGAQTQMGDFISVDNGLAGIASIDTTFRPVLNFRPKLTYNSINNTGTIEPNNITIIAETNDIQWQVILNPTLTGGAYSWVSGGATKIGEYDITNTGASITISNGSVELGGYARAAGGTAAAPITKDQFQTRITLGTNIDFTASDIICIAARAFTGTATVRATIHAREFK